MIHVLRALQVTSSEALRGVSGSVTQISVRKHCAVVGAQLRSHHAVWLCDPVNFIRAFEMAARGPRLTLRSCAGQAITGARTTLHNIGVGHRDDDLVHGLYECTCRTWQQHSYQNQGVTERTDTLRHVPFLPEHTQAQ